MCHFLKQFLDATKHKGTLHFVQYTDVFTLRPESLHRAQTLLPLLASDPKYSGQHSSTAALADAGRSEACDVDAGGSGACDVDAGGSGATEVLESAASSDTSFSRNSFWLKGLLF